LLYVVVAFLSSRSPSARESVREPEPLAGCAGQSKNDGVRVSVNHLPLFDSEAVGDKMFGSRKVKLPGDLPSEIGKKHGFNGVHVGMGLEIVREGTVARDTIDSSTVDENASQRDVVG
jgi:hypothetical protein